MAHTVLCKSTSFFDCAMPPLNNVEILSLLVRNHPHRSLKAIAEIAGIDSGNLHAALAGRRKLSTEAIRCVAAALGLQHLLHPDGSEELQLVPGTVLHVVQDAYDVSAVATLVKQLCQRAPTWDVLSRAWGFATPEKQPAEEEPGIYMLVIGRIQDSHIIVHLQWPTLRQAMDDDQAHDKMVETLGGEWRAGGFNAIRNKTDWIRVAAGVESSDALDKHLHLGKSEQPDLLEWISVLQSLVASGMSPRAIRNWINAKSNER